MDRLTTAAPAPPWDRFAHWRAWPARLLLALVVALMALAALSPLGEGLEPAPAAPAAPAGPAAAGPPPRGDDLGLYDRAIERIAAGDRYYDFIVEEQRARDYPVRPGLAVRLPTLAYLHAWLGPFGIRIAAAALLALCVAAWWRRLGEEPGGSPHRLVAAALLVPGGALALNPAYLVLHELWAGLLIALAFGLHRRGRWGWSLAAAGLALAIREHALPFVLLMGALAAWRRDWREAAAWATLAALFGALIAWHLALVSQHLLPSDRVSPSWLAMRGLPGWLGNIVLGSGLRLLPHPLAGPLVLLMVLGWAGWRTPAGLTGALLALGYGFAFMVAGRANNFYWGVVVAPATFIGLAFAPMALRSLLRAARGPG